jgi:hypothetical protein
MQIYRVLPKELGECTMNDTNAVPALKVRKFAIMVCLHSENPTKCNNNWLSRLHNIDPVIESRNTEMEDAGGSLTELLRKISVPSKLKKPITKRNGRSSC